MQRPWVLGHRGAPRAATENTLPAFRAALAQGADGVELDVRATATGELVVSHDATLERLAGARVRVRQTSAEVLARYDLGDGARVPRLGDVLDALAGRAVNVEVKTDDGDPLVLARALLAVLQRRPTARVLVSSFDPRVLVALRRRAPALTLGILFEPGAWWSPLSLAAARLARPGAIHPHYSVCTDARVQAWRARGLAVNAWTVDDPHEVVRLARAGVTALITNEPGRALETLRGAGFVEPPRAPFVTPR
jgi:glycerophosphoryl diester phosphodiesterase